MTENETDITCPKCNQKLRLGLYIPKEAYQNKPQQPQPPLNVKDAEALFDPAIAQHLEFSVKTTTPYT